MRSIFTFLISGFLLLGASSRALAQHITPENSSIDVAAAAGSSSVNVDSDVSWTASADETWITSAVNNGSGQLEIAYEENTTTSPRDAIITLTDGSINATVTVNQAGAAPVLNVNPSSRSAAKGGETVTFSVSSNITWSAVDDAGWLELSNSSNQISATAAANNTVEERTATITVSGSGVSSVNVTVTQAAGDASVNVTPSNRNVTSPAGSTTFDVT
ncbi:MAG TPA: BACON domain-containing protein, partial [Ignavibacteriales bacterium]|nr:BACON domain-containing protein [Ignavibacteriales bacterium]